MAIFKPKYITFDIYGTLIYFQIGNATRTLYADRVPANQMDEFVKVFEGYRRDEVLYAWKPYFNVIDNAIRRTCKRCGAQYREGDGKTLYDLVPTWGPHADVTPGLTKVAKEFPLVGLTNASNDQIASNMQKIDVPFYAVYTAESAQSYKPQMKAFEYMFDHLNCGPEDILHVSASMRYDLMTAYDMGIKNKVFVQRGYEPGTPYYEYTEIPDINGLPAVVGIK